MWGRGYNLDQTEKTACQYIRESLHLTNLGFYLGSEQTSTVSFWPQPHAWVRGTLSTAPWTYHCEEWYRKREGHFANNVFIPATTTQWRKNMRFQHKMMESLEGYEHVAQDIIENLIARRERADRDARMDVD